MSDRDEIVAKVMRDALSGTGVMKMNPDGSTEHVPLEDFYISAEEHFARSMYLADGGRNWNAETEETRGYWMRRAALRGRFET